MHDVLKFLRGILFLCRKEMLAILKEPANRVILIAPALVQSLLFGYAASFHLLRVSYAVLDHSGGEAARRLQARLEGTGVFERQATLACTSQIAQAIESGTAWSLLNWSTDI